MKKTGLFALPICLMIVALAGSSLWAQPAGLEKPLKVYEVGDKAPDFSLYDGLASGRVELYKDILSKAEKLVALTFMNTTCSACRAEVVILSKLAAKHNENLKVYLVAVDMRGKLLVKAYNENYKYNVEYLLDPKFSVPPAYGFGYTPALVVLDKEGTILYKKGGYFPTDADVLIKAIEDLL